MLKTSSAKQSEESFAFVIVGRFLIAFGMTTGCFWNNNRYFLSFRAVTLSALVYRSFASFTKVAFATNTENEGRVEGKAKNLITSQPIDSFPEYPGSE
ncbi:MAG: hypothetical protein WBG90_11735 [Saonia sp.]